MLVVKNRLANAGDIRDTGSIPGWGRYPEEGSGNRSSVIAWRIPMDWAAWRATVRRVAKSWTRLKQLTHIHTHKHNFFIAKNWQNRRPKYRRYRLGLLGSQRCHYRNPGQVIWFLSAFLCLWSGDDQVQVKESPWSLTDYVLLYRI